MLSRVGLYSLILRAYINDYPSNTMDIDVTVNVIDCASTVIQGSLPIVTLY
jgi:hypothetical protein